MVTLEELLEKDRIVAKDLEAYYQTVGLDKIKKADLDEIIRKFGDSVMHIGRFEQVYEVKVRESNRRLLMWLILACVLSGAIGGWRLITQLS